VDDIKDKEPNLILNLIMKILVKDRSSMQTPLLLSRPQQFNQKNQQILKRERTFSFIDVGEGDLAAFYC
jgi:hypothetical protein